MHLNLVVINLSPINILHFIHLIKQFFMSYFHALGLNYKIKLYLKNIKPNILLKFKKNNFYFRIKIIKN
jgi:hypothetical protein